MKTPEPVIKYLELEDQQRLLEAIPEEHRDIFLFMFVFGVRPSEARALQWDCVDFRNRRIVIRRNFSEHQLVNIPKEGDWKTLPMPPVIEEMLLRRARDKKSPFVFCHSEGTQGKF
ncbi:tyrosine-type recombinase/integrase [Thermosulfurimonas sp. F29]|nr:tyrosine-type recombinase/integrase [Thermosulfurimonas sp. F29]